MKPSLRIPQVRVLKALMPKKNGEKPLLDRMSLAKKAGFNPTTGTINRVLNGIPEGSSSGQPHPGLLELGYIKRRALDIDGVIEVNYYITADGIKALVKYLTANRRIPEVRSADLCTNERYN